MARRVLAATGVLTIAIAACGATRSSSPHGGSSPTLVTATTSTAAVGTTTESPPAPTPESVLQRGTGASPLLIPAVPKTWTAVIGPNGGPHGYGSITYTAPDSQSSVTLSIAIVGNLPISQHMVTTNVRFRSDPRADYQVDDTTVATSGRHLIWTEPGTWAGTGDSATPPPWRTGSVPYLLSTAGLTDGQFWQLAASLHPWH